MFPSAMTSTTKKACPAGYRLIEGPPSVSDYLALRSEAGLAPISEQQGVLSLKGSFFVAHAVVEGDATKRAVAMSRVFGDGGMCASF